jgi:glutathione S-transferase
MKLYFATATCSHAPHIALREAGLPFSLVRYDMKTGLLEDGRAIAEVNPKGYVPVLELDDGRRLTEVAAILQYVADAAPASNLAPAPGSFDRYRLQEWLHFIGMEIHKIYWPLFHDGTAEERAHATDKLARSFAVVEAALTNQPYLMGETFTVADAYLVTTLNWTKPAGIDLAKWPVLSAYRIRLRERPGVMAALEGEGLLRKK